MIGCHGFIGKAMATRLGNVTTFPTDETKVLFHFGSYTHPDFEQNPEYLMQRELDDFTRLLPLCYERGIVFVYPSSALVYEKPTQFAQFKRTLESLAACYKTVTLGLRIFPAYGPGENRTVISKWCRQVLAGEQPVVYGDGTQTRDFIFIDDVVDQILSLVEKPNWTSRVVDIGTGTPTSFNEILSLIGSACGREVNPKYVARPSSYAEGIRCSDPLPWSVPVAEGIRRILAKQGMD